MQLEPCPACQRHVRTDEHVCPFCAADIGATMAKSPRRALPGERLGRAALMSFSLGAASLAAACDDDNVVPVYGAPIQPEPDAGRSTKDGGTLDAGSSDAGSLDAGARDAGDAKDGGSPPSDAGPKDAGATDAGRDAGKDAGPQIVPLYGGPPVPVYGAPPQNN